MDGSTWINAGSALLGALVGGAIAYRATVKAMRHEAELRRLERLRAVRGQMVEEFSGPYQFAFGTDPIHTSWEPFAPLEKVVRLAYSATPDDQSLAREAYMHAIDFVATAGEVSLDGSFNEVTGKTEYPPEGEERAKAALEQLQGDLVNLDMHLRDTLSEE